MILLLMISFAISGYFKKKILKVIVKENECIEKRLKLMLLFFKAN